MPKSKQLEKNKEEKITLTQKLPILPSFPRKFLTSADTAMRQKGGGGSPTTYKHINKPEDINKEN